MRAFRRFWAMAALAAACAAWPLGASADGGGIQFRGAIVAPSQAPATLAAAASGADASQPGIRVAVVPLTQALSGRIPLLDYFASRVGPAPARVVEVSYD